MQVTVVYEPIAPADLYQPCDVLVLPIFVDVATYERLLYDARLRRTQVFDYLKSRNVSFIGLPDNVAILFLCVRKHHKKKRILKHARRLYTAAVAEDYNDFDMKLPGLRNVFVSSASEEPDSEFLHLAPTRNPLIIHSGDDRLDRLFRTKIRTGEFVRYTPDALAHPTVRLKFCRLLRAIGMENGFDLEIVNLIRHRRKVFITCDVMEVEAS